MVRFPRRRGHDVELDLASAQPLLKVGLYQDDTEALEAPPSVARPVASGLSAVLVLDLPESPRPVTAGEVERWGADVDTLFDVAYGNVRGGEAPEVEKLTLDESVELIVAERDSFFTASHVLWLPEVIGAVPEAGALVSVPHRQVILTHLLTGRTAVLAVQRLLTLTWTLYEQGPESLSPQLYWWRSGAMNVLPSRRDDGGGIQFFPTDDFIEVLNGLVS